MRLFLTFTTLVYGVFGLGILLIPGPFLAPYGLDLNASGVLNSRILGSALLGFAVAFWQARSATPAAIKGLILGSFIYNLIDTGVLAAAMNGGELSVLGWIPIGLHTVMTLGFGWFALRPS